MTEQSPPPPPPPPGSGAAFAMRYAGIYERAAAFARIYARFAVRLEGIPFVVPSDDPDGAVLGIAGHTIRYMDEGSIFSTPSAPASGQEVTDASAPRPAPGAVCSKCGEWELVEKFESASGKSDNVIYFCHFCGSAVATTEADIAALVAELTFPTPTTPATPSKIDKNPMLTLEVVGGRPTWRAPKP